MGKCHICGSETEWECRDCERFVCENCTMHYNKFSQIDYTLCKACGGEAQEKVSEEYSRQIEFEKQKEKERLIRNEKQRKYYSSEKAVEKRRLKKIEKLKKEQEYREERMKIYFDIFKDIFQHL
jgi:hypothetical protein